MTAVDTELTDQQLSLIQPEGSGAKGKGDKNCTITQRDLALLSAIYDYGNLLTTGQISFMFWQPDIGKRLRLVGVSDDQIQQWLTQYSSTQLYENLEFCKWLDKLSAPEKLDERMAISWSELAEKQPQARAQIESMIAQIKGMSAPEWLSFALSRQIRIPSAFHERPQLPSLQISSACKQRLIVLRSKGLLHPIEQPTRLSEGSAQYCWTLTRQSRQLVAQMRGVQIPDLQSQRAQTYGMLHLSHRIGLNDIFLAFARQCEIAGYRVQNRLDDNDLKRMLANEKVKLIRGVPDSHTGTFRDVEERHNLKIPDGYLWLDLGKAGQRHCFIEFDNQTLTIDNRQDSTKDFAHKIRTMSVFYRSGRYHELFPQAGDSMWYLTITSGGKTRLNNLKSVTEQVVGDKNRGADRYWFTTKDNIHTWQNFFSGSIFTPIWLRAGQEKLWALDEVIEANV